MPGSPPEKGRARRSRRREGYHHGALREELVAAALERLDEGGVDAVTVREVARRAGVSPAAPFRHFADRAALLAAVAELIGLDFRMRASQAARDAGENPLRQFRATGLAYIRYAIDWPRRFQLMHSEACGDRETLALFTGEREAAAMIEKGQREAAIRAGSPEALQLAAQALVYGLSRMIVDGHISRKRGAKLAEAVLDVFGRGIAPARPQRKR